MEILIIEDDPSTRTLLSHLLASRGHRATACASAEEAIEQYRLSFYPLVLLDLCLPGMSGFDFCRWLRSQPDGDRPYILVGTASKETSDLRHILEAGADDYLVKPYGPSLFDVRLAVAEQSLQLRAARRQLAEDLRKERERLTYLAKHDPLTKLCNREHFTGAIEDAVAAAVDGPPGALLYLDLDHFKIVNDALGHAAGDRLLVQIAYTLRNAARGQDMVARFGGDKFLLLQENIPLAEARLTAERIRGRAGDFVFSDSGRSFHVGVSIGLAEVNGRTPAERVLAAADAACYSAKRHGRNRVEMHQADDCEVARLRRDAQWSAQLRQALRANAVELWFQPVVEIETGRAAFHAALPRIRTADGEVVEPPVFREAAERFRMAAEIDRRVVKLAARALAADPALHLAMPLSGQSLDEAGLAGFIQKSFAVVDVAPGRVTLEIAAPAVLARPDSARAVMEPLREAGFRFALDDFGAGFASFGYLGNLPVDLVKIDGRFVRGLDTEPADLAFVKVLNDIARHAGAPSVAEQVGTPGVVKALRGLGVRYAQGNYYHAPAAVPAW